MFVPIGYLPLVSVEILNIQAFIAEFAEKCPAEVAEKGGTR
jgi:hypothetical protein